MKIDTHNHHKKASDNLAFVFVINLTIPENIKLVGKFAFYQCSNITSLDYYAKNIEYEDNINPFYGLNCSITIKNTVRSIPRLTFWGVTTSDITIEEGVEKIGEMAFLNNTELSEIVFPKTITYIGDNIFYGCSNINSILFKNEYGIDEVKKGRIIDPDLSVNFALKLGIRKKVSIKWEPVRE